MRTRAQAAADRKELWRQIDREQRAVARSKLADLRAQIRGAREQRARALREAKERCRTERLVAKERARALRLRLLQEMRDVMRAERASARQACSVRQSAARAMKDDVARARHLFVAERDYQRALRRIERANRQRRHEAPSAARLVRRSESDDEVRANLPPEFVALFEKVKRGIKGSARESRTEAFLRWAEHHPAEVLSAIDDKTDALVRDLQRRERELARSSQRTRRGRPHPPEAFVVERLPEEHPFDGLGLSA